MELPFLIFLCIMPAVFTALIQFFVFKHSKNKIIKILPTIILLSVFTTFYILYCHFGIGHSMLHHILMCFSIGSVSGIPLYFLSQKLKIRYIVTLIVGLYCLIMVGINASAQAEIFYEPYFRVEYNNDVYVKYSESNYSPYELLAHDIDDENGKRIFIKGSLFSIDFLSPYSENFDKNHNFVWLSTYDEILVKKDFVLPTLGNNEVEAVWMSASSSDEDHITDKETVDKIVECIKSNGEIELDKKIVDYIKKYSWDYHCFHLKYKDCPIIEEYHICKNEDGKYTIEQFTEEEYETIYYDDVAHYKH